MSLANRYFDSSKAIRVVGVVASPSSGGRTLVSVQQVLAGCTDAGAETALIELTPLTDLDPVLEAVDGSDAVVFGSPTYRAGHTALLGTLLESIGRGASWETGAQLQGKAAAIVLTGAAPEHFMATERLRDLLCGFFAVQVLSPSLYLHPQHFGDKVLTSEGVQLAQLSGRALVDLAGACMASKELAALRPLV